MKRRFTVFLLLAIILPFAVYAQSVTTAGINGIITDALTGEKLAGATIRLENQTTGVKLGQKTNPSARFNFVGLRPGGPYTLTATYVGHIEFKMENINLEIGQNLSISLKLDPEEVRTKDVVVVAEKSQIINSGKTGSSQYVSENDLMNMPTMDRNLNDFSRLSPAITTTGVNESEAGTSVGGRNNRYNNIQIDGATMNDVYGLNATGTPGGGADAQPISLDAIQEFQVSISPFDVRQGGFTGGSINAITRSGTNHFKGSAYYYGKNASLVGDKPTEYPDFNDMTIGGRVGGPIVKDQLFYFANVEYRDKENPKALEVGTTAVEGAINQFFIDPAQLAEIRQTTIDRYGYDPGSYSPYTQNTDDIKIFARLDYNLNDRNRLSLRHNYVNANSAKGVDRYSTTFSFAGQEYTYHSKQNQTVLQLNSVVGDNMANELRLSMSIVNDERNNEGAAFPSIVIQGMGEKDGTVQFGVEKSSQANSLDQHVFEIADNFSIFAGDHSIMIGTSNQIFSFKNLFIQNYMGSWTFYSYEDFVNGTPNKLEYTYSNDPNNLCPATEFGYIQLGFYAQDTWTVLPNLKLTYGLRYDLFTFPDSPDENPTFAADFLGLHTSNLPTPNAISPRIGFNWDVFDDSELQLRGGLGIFSGNTPGVWIGNQFSNSGMMFSTVYLTSDLPAFDPANWQNLRDEVIATSTTQKSEIAITADDFKMPQLFRINLGADYHLGYGFIGTIDLMYGKSLNEIYYRNLNIEYATDENGNGITTIDGRPVYNNPYNSPKSSNFQNVIEMGNTSKGYQYSIAVQLQKPFNQGILPNMSANISYSTLRAKDVNSVTSSVALSNWRYNVAVDPNNPDLVTSNFQIDHRIMANVSYRHQWSKFTSTTIGLYYEGRSGSPFSFLFYTNSRSKYWDRSEKIKDANNDNFWSNDVVYIPEILSSENGWSDDKMILVNGAEQDTILNSGKTYGQLFEEFLDQYDDIERGKICERNSQRSSWRHFLDVKITQQFRIYKHYKMDLSLDIMNVLNLLNSDWGKSEYVLYGTYSLLEFDGYEDPNNPSSRIKAAFYPNSKGNTKSALYQQSDLWSRWRMQFGIRLYF